MEYDPQTGAYSLTPEQAFALTDPDGAVYAPGAFELALGSLRAEQKVTEAFRTGPASAGTSTTTGCSPAASASSGPDTRPTWWPAGCRPSTASRPSSRAGARVADVGCGHGASTDADGQRLSRTRRFTGSDYHEGSIIQARKRAADAGLGGQVTFDVASAQTFAGGPYDLVTHASTACTTWATRSARPGTSGRCSRRTAPGWWSSPTPAPAWPTTSTRSAGSTTPSPRFLCVAERAVPGRWLLTRRPGRRGADPAARHRRRASPGSAGWPRRPFNIVYEARP